MPTIDIEATARMAHEVIRAWCEFNDDHTMLAWDDAPAWQREATFDGVQFHLDNPDADDDDAHEGWLEIKRRAGWTWGPVKDHDLKQHPSMVPFDQLSREEQFKDRLFLTIANAARRGGG